MSEVGKSREVVDSREDVPDGGWVILHQKG